MVPVEVRKIIVESRAKGIPAEEIRKVTGVSLSAINNIVSNYKKKRNTGRKLSGKAAENYKRTEKSNDKAGKGKT